MAETYCGKTCADCAQKEQLTCPGCKAGPGRQVHGDCTIARCCRGKGHQECATCGFYANCNTVGGKYRMPEYRLKAIEEEKNRLDAIVKRAPVLGKWLWILFWLIIPSAIASLMSQEVIVNSIPALLWPGQILSVTCNLVYSLILFRLASEEDRYRTAGICGLINVVISLALLWVSGDTAKLTTSGAGSVLLLSLPAAVLGFIGKYNEFTAHSVVLTGLNNTLAVKWSKLWKWYIATFVVMIGGVLLLLIIPFLGLLAVLAGAIALVVVSILQLVYLYKTAKIFRDVAV